MQEPCCLERYPAMTVVLSNLVSLLIYAAGAYILYRINLVLAVIYVIFILILESRLTGRHCVDCYYYGKTCAFGKGFLSSLLFPGGTPACVRNVSSAVPRVMLQFRYGEEITAILTP